MVVGGRAATCLRVGVTLSLVDDLFEVLLETVLLTYFSLELLSQF